jgi:ankyrin repeat protein
VRTTTVLCTLLAAISIACGSPELPHLPGQPDDDRSYAEDPFPLDAAILADNVDAVRSALDAGADPNARWSSHGDHFPLQEAIDAGSYGAERKHRAEIVRLLLRHHADPDARWCPFESRGGFLESRGCQTETGFTALTAAAAYDQADTTYLLLDAGANPLLQDARSGSALEYASGRAVFELLVAGLSRDSATRRPRTLAYLSRNVSRDLALPRNQTVLAQHFAGGATSALWLPPPPPPPPSKSTRRTVARGASQLHVGARRLDLLLSVGANPNERVRGMWDWTPLAFAVNAHDPQSAQVLLSYGADPNERWCATPVVSPTFECIQMHALTPLMWAAQLGDIETIRVLLRGGANPALLDWRNRRATDFAPPEYRSAVLEALAETPAKRSAVRMPTDPTH